MELINQCDKTENDYVLVYDNIRDDLVFTLDSGPHRYVSLSKGISSRFTGYLGDTQEYKYVNVGE